MYEIKVKNINGLQVGYREAGSGDLLLCLHAVGHDSADYLSVLKFFKDTHKVVALDWPGHGKSDRLPDQPILRSSYEAWLVMVCSHFGWERFSLIGNSIGGDVAIRFAHAHPKQVQGLVLANPGGLLPMNFLSKAAVGFMAWFFGRVGKGGSWARAGFRWYYHQVLSRPEAHKRREEIIAQAQALGPLLQEAWQGFGNSNEDSRPFTATINCPTLFTWASRDKLISYRQSEKSINQIPMVETQFFNAGHSAFLEDPDGFNQAVMSWYQKHFIPVNHCALNLF